MASSPRVLPSLQEETQAPLLRHRSPARRKKLTNKIGVNILEAVSHFLTQAPDTPHQNDDRGKQNKLFYSDEIYPSDNACMVSPVSMDI